MAITQRTGPHDSWLVIAGQSFQCIEGEVMLTSVGATGTIKGRLPLNAPGYMEALAGAGMANEDCEAVVMTANGVQPLAKGKVKKIEFDLTGGIIYVEARDAMADLHNHQSFDSFKNQTTSQVVEQVAQKAGVPVSVRGASSVMAGKKVKDDYVYMTDGQSASTIINNMGRMGNAKWWVDAKSGVLNYQEGFGGAASGGSYTLFWKRPLPGSPMISDCLALTVIHNIDADSVEGVDAFGWDPQKKQIVKSGGNGGDLAFGGPPNPKLENPTHDQQQAKALADSRFAATSSHAWEVRATVVGDPSLDDPSMSVELTGTGVFDKTYEIDKIVHRFGYNGYTTTINSKGKGNGGSK